MRGNSHLCQVVSSSRQLPVPDRQSFNRTIHLAEPRTELVRTLELLREEDCLSHIVTIQTKVHDPHAVAAACRRLNLAAPVQGTAKLYSGEAEGLVVRFPGWQYPAVVDPLTGTVRYDLFNGV
jgi:hypothetical protein